MTREGVRWHAGFAYIDRARSRDNLTILADTLVERLLLDGERAVGVATSNGEIRAGIVVLAASAYGSPAILLRSGIGADGELPVGENLCDHVGTGMAWEPTDELRADWEAWQGEHQLAMAGITIPLRSCGCPEGVCDLFVFPATDPGYEISAAVFAMKPVSRGRVSLTSKDPRAPLHIEHGFLAAEADVRVLVEGFDRLRRLAQTEPISRYAAREARPGADVDAEAHLRSTARGFFHPTGTCSIGKVVDERARVLGYTNLLVADVSIMPTIPRANTNLTAAAIGERVAELI
jgi:choline dehydrogenase